MASPVHLAPADSPSDSAASASHSQDRPLPPDPSTVTPSASLSLLPPFLPSSPATISSKRDSLNPSQHGWAASSHFGPFPTRDSELASLASRAGSPISHAGGRRSWNESPVARPGSSASDLPIATLLKDYPHPQEMGARWRWRDSISSSEATFSGVYPLSPPVLFTTSMKEKELASLLWSEENAEADDYLHNPSDELDRRLDRSWGIGWSARGVGNVGLLFVVLGGIVGVFMFWPLYTYVWKRYAPYSTPWNFTNATGQVPSIPNLPSLIDRDTPESAYTRTGFDGETYNLVFSDEFEVEGRTFWEGDDPFWEAVNLHYWQTTDLEWYDPDAAVTKDGKLVITLSEEPINGMNFRSAFVGSWNKFCFTGGYIEISASLPGNSHAQGYWPGAWTQGNLGRAGFGAANHGTWPYSYNTCDVGTLPNQTWPNGTSPTAAKTSGDSDYGGELSYQPGQRLSACTCEGEDHPGPNVRTGRGAPEIDIIEAQVDSSGVGSASQSLQIAPMDSGYAWGNTSETGTTVWDTSKTIENLWHGSVNQESASQYTLLNDYSYEDAGYQTFGFEYVPGGGDDGRITWAVNGSQTWEVTAKSFGPNAQTEIGQRLIAAEPMSINLNLAISTKFQTPAWGSLTFPGHFFIDYVRVYQKGTPNIGCDPVDFPTADYIARHSDVYSNPNLTVWGDTNYTWPRNSLSAEGCA